MPIPSPSPSPSPLSPGRYGGKVSARDSFGKTPWDYVHEGCPDNRGLNKMMKEAFDLEERNRVQVNVLKLAYCCRGYDTCT